MSIERLRVAIVGCGPAGLAAAIALNSAGHDVSLFERFDVPKPLGSGIVLQPTGLAVLRAMNLEDRILTLGHRIDHMLGHTMPRHKVVLDVNYDALGAGTFGLAVHRAALFEVLYERVLDNGIEVQTGTDVVDVRQHRDFAELVTGRGQSVGRFDLVVDGSGANSTLHEAGNQAPSKRWLDFGAIWGSFEWPGEPFREHCLQQRYVGAHTMIGVLPIGRHASVDTEQVAFFWSLRHRDYERWLADGLDAWKKTVREIWPETEAILAQITDPNDMSLARYGHFTLRTPRAERVAYIGDAAHSTSPQLGQGANMAMLDAWALHVALERSRNVAEALQRYARLRRWHVRLFQAASYALTPFYQSDSATYAWLRDAFFDPVSRLPIARRVVAGLVSGLLVDPLGPLDLSRTTD